MSRRAGRKERFGQPAPALDLRREGLGLRVEHADAEEPRGAGDVGGRLGGRRLQGIGSVRRPLWWSRTTNVGVAAWSSSPKNA